MADELRAQGRKPYVVPGGGSNPLGALGYVSCAQELLQQSFDMGVNFDHIICPSGSTGTHAGVLSGILGNNANIPVTGISVNRKKEIQTDAVFNLTQRTMDYSTVKISLPRIKLLYLTTMLVLAIPCLSGHG